MLVWRREAALGWVLVPAPLLFLLFMGLQGRYFGRWLLPIFPIACLLAAISVAMLVGAIGGRSRAVRWLAAAVAVRAACWPRASSTASTPGR